MCSDYITGQRYKNIPSYLQSKLNSIKTNNHRHHITKVKIKLKNEEKKNKDIMKHSRL